MDMNEIRAKSPFCVYRKNGFVWEIPKDLEDAKYRGCGSGWLEVDNAGTPVDMGYFPARLDDELEAGIPLIDDIELALSDNSGSEGCGCCDLYPGQFGTWIPAPENRDNGRIAVNFSCCSACEF